MKKWFPLFVVCFFFVTLLLTPLLVSDNNSFDLQSDLSSQVPMQASKPVSGFETIIDYWNDEAQLQLWLIKPFDDYPARAIVSIVYRDNLRDGGLSILKSEVERFVMKGKNNLQLDGSAYSLRFEGGNPLWFPFHSDIFSHGHFTCLTFALKWRMETNNVIVVTGDYNKSFSEYDLQPQQVLTVSSQNK